MKFVVVELDPAFNIDTATLWDSILDAENYKTDLLAAYEYAEGVDLRIIKIEEPLDRAGLKAIAAISRERREVTV